MFVTKCECCGDYTIRAIRASTGEILWSDRHDLGIGGSFEDNVFAYYTGEETPVVGETCLQEGVEIEAFGDHAGVDIQLGYIARYADKGVTDDFLAYSTEFASIYTFGLRPDFVSSALAIPGRAGYWKITDTMLCQWDANFDMVGKLTLDMPFPSQFGGFVRETPIAGFGGGFTISFNGQSTVDVIRTALAGEFSNPQVTGRNAARYDAAMSQLQLFTNQSPGIHATQLGCVGDGTLVGVNSNGEMFRTDSSFVAGAGVAIDPVGGLSNTTQMELMELNSTYTFPASAYHSGSNRSLVVNSDGVVFALVSIGSIDPFFSVGGFGLIVFDSATLTYIGGALTHGGTYIQSHGQYCYIGGPVSQSQSFGISKWSESGLLWSTTLSTLEYVHIPSESASLPQSVFHIISNTIQLENGDVIVVGSWTSKNPELGIAQIARLDGDTGEILWEARHSLASFLPLLNVTAGPDECILYAVGPSSSDAYSNAEGRF